MNEHSSLTHDFQLDIVPIMSSLRRPCQTTSRLLTPQFTFSASIRLQTRYCKSIRSFCSDISEDTNPDSNSSTIDKRAYPIALSSFIGGIGMGVVLPILPQLANEVGINTMQYGLVFAVSGLARLATNIPAGVISDKFGRKSTLVGGPVLSALGTFMMGHAHTMNALMTAQYISGTGGSMQVAGAQTYLSDISTVKNRARTMAPMAIGMSAGMVMGPFIGGLLCDYFGSVRIPFHFVCGALGVVALNNWYMLPETLSKTERKKKSGYLHHASDYNLY